MKRNASVLLTFGLALACGTALATNVGEMVLKTVGIGAVVTAVAKPADKAINSLVGNKNLPVGVSTKVVPVLSLGEKGYVGMAQVGGGQSLVAKTKAVLQVETAFDNKQYRIKLLIPVNSVNPIGAGRVRGLGITGLLDTGLSRNAYELPSSVGWNIGDVLKAGVIGVAASQFGPQINTFINSALKNQNASPIGATKVVPYLSFGSKAYIGMMQVAGPAAQVKQVKAVWQYEQLFDAGRVRLRALVPSDSVNPTKIRRIKGVGCTAVIDAMVLREKDRRRRPDHYRYFSRAPIFVGLHEDPRYRPPGWDRGRKEGWQKNGNGLLPPGLAKKQPNRTVRIFDGVRDDKKNDENHSDKGKRKGHKRGRGHDMD